MCIVLLGLALSAARKILAKAENASQYRTNDAEPDEQYSYDDEKQKSEKEVNHK